MQHVSLYKIPPPEFNGPSMSNSDNSIDPGTEEYLKAGNTTNHFSWEFCGDVWWCDECGNFHENVYQYHSLAASYVAPTLRELMDTVNDNHGWG